MPVTTEMDVLQSLQDFINSVDNGHTPANAFERKLSEYILWYSANHQSFGHAGLDKKVDFQDKALGGLLHVLYLAAQELRQMRGQGAMDHGIIIPHWVGNKSVPVRVRMAG